MSKLVFKLKLFFYKLFHKISFQDPKSIVCYIYGATELPEPLSSEEEQSLLTAKSQGDDNALNLLIEHNLRLVVFVAKKFKNCNIEFEDLISIGSLGLIKAVKTFSLEKNIKLATYACRCIENEILMQIRKDAKLTKNVSFDKPLNVDKEGNKLLLSDILQEDDPSEKMIDDDFDMHTVRSLISKLKGREKEIMLLRYGLVGDKEFTQKEVADRLGISQSYISRIEKKILDDMRVQIEKL